MTSLDPTLVQGLRAGLRGPVLAASDPGYDETRAIWNAMIDRRPALIARCIGVSDVLACVRFAREHSLALSMRGGGHNIAGLALAEGGLLVDLSLMRGVWVDPAARVARAQGGCLLGDVDRETQLHGLAAALGFVSATGCAGLTLGGGFGYLSRRFGWTSDGVRAMELVTADGRQLRASEKENPDLFWGLRGGGGNFGVVTGIEYELHPVGPEIYGGPVAWRAESAGEVLELFRTLASEAPRELTLVGVMRKAPPAPWLAKDAHGQLIVMLLACYSGKPEDGEKLLAPLKALGKPVGDLLQRRPYVSLQNLLDATQPKGRRYYWKSEYLPGITAELVAKQREHAERILSPHSAVIVFQLGGAIADRPADHSAVGNRDAAAVLNVAASWEKPEDDAANVEWARSTWRDMKRFSTGGTYVNFLTEDEPEDRVAAAYGTNLERLSRIKASWDPQNVFRMNKNIAPAAS
ncbi:MAG TPA: FAD-binding oxidoreductase [Vicinamibacteria bacterium]|jgi:FAD/FMN-containing dehydrogenase